MWELLASWLQLLVPQPCFDRYFNDFDFLDGQCFRVVISKVLGYGIIAGSILVKVPQIIKIFNAKSAEGVSIYSTTLELIACTASLAYGFNQGFPFSSYGESGFMALQTLLIAILSFAYNKNARGAVLYNTVFAAALAYLMSGEAPQSLLVALQSAIIPILVTARMIQAVSNMRNGHTGQLSPVTWFLLLAGSTARIFTSFQETGDQILILTFVISAACNSIIFFQICYYAKATKIATQKKAA